MKRRMYGVLILCTVTLFACGNQRDVSDAYTKDAQVEMQKQEEYPKDLEESENNGQEKEVSEHSDIEQKETISKENTTSPPSTKNNESSTSIVTPPPVVSEKPVENERVSKVSISIDTKTLLNNMDKVAQNKKAYVPSDGWILAPITVEINEGDTVFDVLSRVTRDRRIHMEYEGANQNVYNSVYIQGIAQLYEFDCGELSGWMYTINGAYVSKGASGVSVEDGMNIEWRYTCDLGRDLGL